MKKEDLTKLFGFISKEREEKKEKKNPSEILSQLKVFFGIQDKVKKEIGEMSSEEIIVFCEREANKLKEKVRKPFQKKLIQAKQKNLFSSEIMKAEVYLDKYGFLNRSQLKQLRKSEEE